MLDYKEPSLAFYQGGTLREHRATIDTDGVLASAPRWLVITREVWERSPKDARDRVEIVETRPMSKDKRWRVVRLIERIATQ